MKREAALAKLSRLSHLDRMPHALCLVEGSQRENETLAYDLARTIHCLHATPEGPCRKCSACTKMDGHHHPDLFILQKEKREITLDEVKTLIRWLFVSPNESKRKIAIVHQAQSLNRSAANALLKTLEEPPSFSNLILISSTQDQLLPTIQSRLLVVRMQSTSPRDEEHGEEPEWLSDLQVLVEKRHRASNADILNFTQQISKDRDHLHFFYRFFEKKITETYRQTLSPDFGSPLDSLFREALRAEHETVVRYGNIALQAEALLLKWRDLWRPNHA